MTEYHHGVPSEDQFQNHSYNSPKSYDGYDYWEGQRIHPSQGLDPRDYETALDWRQAQDLTDRMRMEQLYPEYPGLADYPHPDNLGTAAYGKGEYKEYDERTTGLNHLLSDTTWSTYVRYRELYQQAIESDGPVDTPYPETYRRDRIRGRVYVEFGRWLLNSDAEGNDVAEKLDNMRAKYEEYTVVNTPQYRLHLRNNNFKEMDALAADFMWTGIPLEDYRHSADRVADKEPELPLIETIFKEMVLVWRVMRYRKTGK